MKLVLASASPRRKELLEHFGYDFSLCIPQVKEETFLCPVETVVENAKRKALDVFSKEENHVVVGADTIVVLDNRILEKPKDEADAHRMLSDLSGKTHFVMTAVAIFSEEKKLHFVETTEVTFRKVLDEEICQYLMTKEPFDKAGAYGIQGFGGLLVEGIKGCYYNVVGLPVPRLAVTLCLHDWIPFPYRRQGGRNRE